MAKVSFDSLLRQLEAKLKRQEAAVAETAAQVKELQELLGKQR